MTRHIVQTPDGTTKIFTLETTALLAANASFIGQWHDTILSGITSVEATAFTSTTGSNSGFGFRIEETDDPTNPTLVRQLATGFNSANTYLSIQAIVRARYWRVSWDNGATAQSGKFQITTCSVNFYIPTSQGNANGILTAGIFPIIIPSANSGVNDNQPSQTGGAVGIPGTQNQIELIVAADTRMYGGSFSGTANAALQGWSRARTPTIQKTVQASAIGSTALWTPGAGNKFRLLSYLLGITANASLAAPGVLTVKLLDAAADIAQDIDLWLPAAAAGAKPSDNYYLPLINLGFFGVLSATANNVLNVNLSAALTTGNVRVISMGTEE